MFDVPDDWAVTPADGGLQLVSPDRSSIILAGMAKSDKAGLANWQRAAARRMVDFGIAFDPKATGPKMPRPIADDNAFTPLAGATMQPTVKAGELAPLSSMPSMALLGRPSDLSVAGLGAADGIDAGKAAADKVETPKPDGDKTAADETADKAAADKANKPLHFASVVIRGASLAGKPVDVQFLNFGYSKDRWFLMQQESGGDDDRAGAIIKSVRAIR